MQRCKFRVESETQNSLRHISSERYLAEKSTVLIRCQYHSTFGQPVHKTDM